MIRFAELREEDLELVLSWRVKPEVTKFMVTDVAFDMTEQRKWLPSGQE